MQAPKETREESRKRAQKYFQSKEYKKNTKARGLFGLSLAIFALPTYSICYFLHVSAIYASAIALSGSFVLSLILNAIFNRKDAQ